MRTVSLLSCLVLALFITMSGCSATPHAANGDCCGQCAATKPTPCSGRKTLIINLTEGKDDLHEVQMALNLAGHGLDDDRNVIIFLNVKGAALAAADLPKTVAFRDHPPISEQLKTLIGRGAKVLVCPYCAKVMGVDQDKLLPGIEPADREKLLGPLGNAVFTY